MRSMILSTVAPNLHNLYLACAEPISLAGATVLRIILRTEYILELPNYSDPKIV